MQTLAYRGGPSKLFYRALEGGRIGLYTRRNTRQPTPPYFYPASVRRVREPGSRVYQSVWRGGKTIVSETRAIQEKARRVLRAAAVEAYGRPGAYVSRHRVMQRTNITDVKEFRAIAEYLDRKGWISEGGDDYGYFVVTAAGIDEAAR